MLKCNLFYHKLLFGSETRFLEVVEHACDESNKEVWLSFFKSLTLHTVKCSEMFPKFSDCELQFVPLLSFNGRHLKHFCGSIILIILYTMKIKVV